MEKNELMKQYEAKVGQRVNWEANPVGYTRWLEAQLIWQSVSEKPKDGQIVFVMRIGGWDVAQYMQGKFYLHNGFTYGHMVESVTHWLPIPMESRND